MIKQIFIAAFLCLFIAGCVSTTIEPISSQTASSLQGKSIAVFIRKTPVFFGDTAITQAIGGLVSVAMAEANGKTLVNETGLKHPLGNIVTTVEQKLTSKYSANLKPRKHLMKKESVTSLSGKAVGSEFAIEFSSVSWGHRSATTGGGSKNLNIYLSTTMQLIDTRKKEVIWKANCIYDRNRLDLAGSTKEELIADQGTLIKSQFQEAATYCSGQFTNKL